MSMVTTPADIFHLVHQEANVRNASHSCSAIHIHFKVSSANLNLDFEPEIATVGYDNQACQELLNSITNGFISAGEEIPLKLDIDSFSVAAALNLGILKIKDREKIHTLIKFTVDNAQYGLQSLYDPRYPHSSLIYCISSSDSNAVTDQLCMIEINGQSALALSYLAHENEGYNKCCRSIRRPDRRYIHH